MNNNWIQLNWFKLSILSTFLVFVVFFSLFAAKYQSPTPEPRDPKIVYLSATSTPAQTPVDLPSMIRKWYPSVVRVECYARDTSGELSLQSGSGFLMKRNGVIGVLTNKHVITGSADASDKTTELCTVRLANSDNPYITKGLSLEGKKEIFVSEHLDWGYILVSHPNREFESSAMVNNLFCSDRSELGANILIMGYPSAGSESDVTATRGIVSGYDGAYYITDAKIGEGNSGGLAIRSTDKNSCFMGIPSFTILGEVINLGRVLNVEEIAKDPSFVF